MNGTITSDKIATTNQDIAESLMASSKGLSDHSEYKDSSFNWENDGLDEILHDNENNDDKTDEEMILEDDLDAIQDEVKDEI